MSTQETRLADYGIDLKIRFLKLNSNLYDRYVQPRHFDCEQDSINEHIYDKALDAYSTTYIFIDDGCDRMICFCTFSCSGVMELTDTDNDVFIARENFRVTSAMEINYFAVDKRYQHLPFEPSSEKGDTLSRYLLNYMQKHLCQIAANHIGAERIILYAVPKAKRFYMGCGFRPFEGQMTGQGWDYVQGCPPMYYDIVVK